MPYLEYEFQNQTLRVKLTMDRQCFIGRDPGCAVSLPDCGDLGGRHCVVYFNTTEGRFALADMFSTRGTLLNGRKIGHRDVLLHDGDRIQAGPLSLTYCDENAEFNSVSASSASFPEASSLIPSVPASGKSPGYSFRFRTGETTPFGTVRTILSDHGDSVCYLLDRPEGNSRVMKLFRSPEAEGALEALKESCTEKPLPGTLPYLGCGALEDGSLYYLTEYRELASYSSLISVLSPITPEQGLSLIYSAVLALNKNYKAGKVHGDLKPSKFFYNPDDGVEVYGCSIASWRRKFYPEILRRPEQWYASPEYFSGDELTWKSDLYSLGIMLFQMITGVLPYRSDSPEELIRMHLEAPLPEPGSKNPECSVPASVTGLLRRMTMKDPVHRFASIHDFVTALGKISTSLEKIHSKTI